MLTETLTSCRLVAPDDEPLSDVVRGRVQLREGLDERDVAVCFAIHESNLAATSLFRAYVPGSGPISSVKSRGPARAGAP